MSRGSSFLPIWRSLATPALVFVWLVVLFSQIYLYTTMTEIVAYAALDLLLVVVFLKWVQFIKSQYALFGVILVIALVLGLVPYKVRLHDWALFFFQSAKDPSVTYYKDPYLNMQDFAWGVVYPILQVILMYAIAKTYQKTDTEKLSPLDS